MSRVVVALLGNRLRGDDAAGPLVADALRAAGADVHIIEADDPLVLLDTWEPDDTVFIVDAVASGDAPGTIHDIDAADPGPPEPPAGSTHAFGLAAMVALTRTLGRMPRRLSILGIEGKRFELGAPVHPAVERAARLVAARIGRAAGA